MVEEWLTQYIIPVSSDTLIRIRHHIKQGAVIHFVVQLEVNQIPVKRYDNAHGFAHIDRYNLNGEKQKESLDLSFNEALTFAEQDIKNNWQMYRERFLKGEWP